MGEDIALIRASVQSTGDGASIALAALDGSMDGSIATNIPANSGMYKDAYQRIVLLYNTPGESIVPVFQVANFGEWELSVYLDNLEVFLIPRDTNISSNLLYGEDRVTPIPTIPSPVNTPTPSPTPAVSTGTKND